jgi:hypothetical protein
MDKLVENVTQREKDAEEFAKIIDEAKKKGASADKMALVMTAFKLGYAVKESEVIK